MVKRDGVSVSTDSVDDLKHGTDHSPDSDFLMEENNLLTSYSSDTVYRLRYDSMEYDYISPAVGKLLGFSVEEMLKVNFRSLIVETKMVTDGMKVVDSFGALEKQRRDGDVNKWQADYLIRRKDGHKIWVSDISYPWFDKDGLVVGSVGSLRDITDRVEAEDKMRKEIDKLANIDSLTGLCNRAEFFSELDKELKRMNRSEEEVSILLIDIDQFRGINDQYGRDVGDNIVVELTNLIKGCLRDTDTPARIGGEEFGVLLPDTTLQGALWVAERIREVVAVHIFSPGVDKGQINCSVSIGVASALPGSDALSSDLYKIADTRLYIAKNTGMNQVSVDEILQTH